MVVVVRNLSGEVEPGGGVGGPPAGGDPQGAVDGVEVVVLTDQLPAYNTSTSHQTQPEADQVGQEDQEDQEDHSPTGSGSPTQAAYW